MATILARNCIFIRAWPQTAWKAVTQLAAWSDWIPSLKKVELEPSGSRGRFRFRGGVVVPFEVTATQDQKLLRVEGHRFGMDLVFEVRLVAITEGSVVTLELLSSSRASGVLVGRFASKALERSLARLKLVVERMAERPGVMDTVPPLASRA